MDRERELEGESWAKSSRELGACPMFVGEALSGAINSGSSFEKRRGEENRRYKVVKKMYS